MAGHSQFKNIMHRKGAQDAKRAKIFTKIIREITVAVKTGSPDANSNPRLRTALASAREANMPKDNIERAMKKALGGDDQTNYEEVRYEGFGPGRVAFIVEGLTDNRNRTAPDVRAAFSKSGGALGESGSVSFMFDRVGLILYPKSVAPDDVIFEAALEAGANNVESFEEGHEILTSVEDFGIVRDALTQKFGDPQQGKIIWKPQNITVLDHDTAKAVLKFIDVLEDHDDIQNVYGNYEFPEDFEG